MPKYVPHLCPECGEVAKGTYEKVPGICTLDLDEDGYAEPYIVTLGKNDWKLLSIVPRYDADSLIWSYDPRNPADRYIIGIDAVEYITSYTYYPSPDGCALGMGIGHLIERLVKSRNSAINQIQDAGTLWRQLIIRRIHHSVAPHEAGEQSQCAPPGMEPQAAILLE